MTPRTYAEALPGTQPAEWYGPASRTNDGPGLGVCGACGHQRHPADVCGYRSVAEDGNSVATCLCGMARE